MLSRWLDCLSARLRASHEKDCNPSYSHSQHKECCPRSECRSLLLNRCTKVYSVVCGCRLTSTGQPGIDVARIHIQGKDEVFLGRAAVGCDHCVQKERARSKIDNRRAGDAHGIKFGAYEIVCGTPAANVALPDNAAIDRIERVDIIRFGRCNNYRRATRAVLDVKRLGINIAEIVPSKFRSRAKLAAADGVNAESM